MNIADDKGYELLLDKITALYESKIGMSASKRNTLVVASYWEIGDMIVRLEKEPGFVKSYEKKLVKKLSGDLTERFGDGFSSRNMFYIRRFRLEYSRENIHTDLSWSHYKTLLGVKDLESRRLLEERILTENISDSKLQSLVRHANGLSKLDNVQDELEPRKGRLNIYKVVAEERNGRKSYLLDCGFKVKRRVPLGGLKVVKSGDYVEMQKGSSALADYSLKTVECETGERYCYQAEVLDVIDGDTLHLRVNLGFDSFIDERFRLRGVDAPELGTEDGESSRSFVLSKVKPGSTVLILTYGSDMYGRYLADVFYSSGKTLRHPTLNSGIFLNMEIIQNGYAGYYKGLKW